jgi:hypothetical protein
MLTRTDSVTKYQATDAPCLRDRSSLLDNDADDDADFCCCCRCDDDDSKLNGQGGHSFDRVSAAASSVVPVALTAEASFLEVAELLAEEIVPPPSVSEETSGTPDSGIRASRRRLRRRRPAAATPAVPPRRFE